MLTGLTRCDTCGAGMTLRTGKSGRYRYYTCAGCAQKGKTHGPGRSISMPLLDKLVLDHIADHLLTTSRLTQMLEAYFVRSRQDDATARGQLAQARKALTEADGRILRLLVLVEQGDLAADDPAMRERLALGRQARQQAAEHVKLLEASSGSGAPLITPRKIERLATALRVALAGDDPAFRKAYLRLFVDQIVVADTEIRLQGPTQMLAKAVNLDQLPPAAAMVPSLVREWL